MNNNNYKTSITLHVRAGFTLIETLIVIAIVIVLTAVAIPSFKHLVSSERLQSVAWQMVEDLREVKADAILYQQDLNVYFNYDNSPVNPLNSSNTNNREYYYERFLYNPTATPVEHYIPTDTPNNHFIKRILKYHIVISNISSTTSSAINFSGKNYFTVTFRSGAGGSFRGEADIVTSMSSRTVGSVQTIGSTPVIITIKDPSTSLKYYIRISATGKISFCVHKPCGSHTKRY